MGPLSLCQVIGLGWIVSSAVVVVGFLSPLPKAHHRWTQQQQPQRHFRGAAWDVSSIGSTRSSRSADATESKRGALSSASDGSNPHQQHCEWLIVGGGIHGVGIATRLLSSHPRASLVIVDEHPALLQSWKERAASTGMEFLRSSAGFHLDVPVEGLRDFAGEYHQHCQAASSNPKSKRKKPSKKDRRKTKNHRNKKATHHQALVGTDYQRPSLQLFNDHCDTVVARHGLRDRHLEGRVASIALGSGESGGPARVAVRTGDGTTNTTPTIELTADNIVLAVGQDEPFVPEWATELLARGARGISHLLQLDTNNPLQPTKSEDTQSGHRHDGGAHKDRARVVAIVGGGISAVHKALQLTTSTATEVHLVSRHPIREQQFDTHQDWMMTDELAARSAEHGGSGLTQPLRDFRGLSSPAERREVIRRERIPGTVPVYMTRARGGLDEGLASGRIRWHTAGIAAVDDVSKDETNNHNDVDGDENEEPTKPKNARQRYWIHLDTGDSIDADEILLATGLGKRPPGHGLLGPLAEAAGLPLSPCGYPLVDASLEWKGSNNTPSRVFVSGGLAELELGPSARNIAGARMAAERIAKAAARTTTTR